MDVYGNDLILPLVGFSYGATTKDLVTGYKAAAGITPIIHGAINIHFSDNTNNVYVWIPFTTTTDS